MNPSEEYIAAIQQLSEAEKQLEADRRHVTNQMRTANRTWPLGSQVAERDDFLQDALVAERQGLARVEEAKQLRDKIFAGLTEDTEAVG